ncbi:MAG: DUF523 domain-containing protein [Firmicutes bacterium]|nr:DUF523 domain-containing protein [Bacillota bacterium]
MNILISACLLGVNCKYDGGNNKIPFIDSLLDKHNFIPICPEQLGGLTTPRLPSEICYKNKAIGSKEDKIIKNIEGLDVTSYFIRGAQEALYICELFKCRKAILKSNSPSCGFEFIYDGTFSGKLTKGNGIFAELLAENGIEIYTEKDLDKYLK